MPKKEIETVSIRELARRLGVSDGAIRKAIKNGRIFGAAIVGSKLDAVLATKQFNQNRDISKVRKKINKTQKNKKKTAAPKQNIVPVINFAEIEQKFSKFEDDEQEEYKPKRVKTKNVEYIPTSDDDKIESELNRQRARKEKANADKAELQVQVMRGELIEVEKATFAVFEVMREQRDHWLRFPDRISAKMAARLGVNKVELKNMLSEEVKNHCKKVEELTFDLPS